MNSIIFQALDWVISDYNETHDCLDNNHFDEFDESSMVPKYLIKVFGKDMNGKNYSLNIRDYKPHFYIKGIDNLNGIRHNENIKDYAHTMIINKLREHIESKLKGQFKNSLEICKIVRKKDLWGFTNNKPFKFILLSFSNFKAMKIASNLFTRNITFGTEYKNIKFQLYENNIEPYLRFIHKQDLRISGWLKVDISKCDKTYDFNIKDGDNYNVNWKDVKPFECNKIAPFIVSSFDIECTSYDGSFPCAIKTYEKFIHGLLDYHNTLNNLLKEEKQEKIYDYIIDTLQNGTLNYKSSLNIDEVSKNVMIHIDDIMSILKGKLLLKTEEIIKVKKTKITHYFSNQDEIEQSFTELSSTEIVEKMVEKFSKFLPKLNGDPIIQIGTTFHKYGSKDCFKKIIVALDTCDDIEGSKVISCKTEKHVIIKWIEIMNSVNPDIITGYNIFGFDFDYIYHRALELNCAEYLCNLGKLVEPIKECKFDDCGYCKTHWTKKTLSSSALGDNFLKYINPEGRVLIDLMKVIQSGHNLDTYKLDYVSRHFINGKINKIEYDNDDENDNDNSNKQIRLYLDNPIGIQKFNYLSLDDTKFYIDDINHDEKYIVIEKDYELFDKSKKYKKWGLAKDDVTPQEIFECQKGTSKDRARVAKYCIQDCALCNYLIIKLEIIANNIGMSNVCSIPFSYIFLRGQGVKIFSLIAKQCKEDNFLIPYQDKKWKCEGCFKNNSSFDDFCQKKDSNDNLICLRAKPENEGFEGAIVLEPKPGIYINEPISVLDYASLYPSSMISENISHDTLIIDEKYDNLPGYEYVNITFDLFKGKGDAKKKIGEQTCRYVQFPNSEKGLLPRILQKLLKQRKATRKKITWKTITLNTGEEYKGNIIDETDTYIKMKVEDKNTIEIDKNKIKSNIYTHNDFEKAILDGLQLAYKLTANSLYGQVGAPTSPIFMKELAASTTATGRNLILSAKKFAEEQYNCEVVYGDSVPFDEPVIIKNGEGLIDIKTLSQIFSENTIEHYETFKNPDFFFTLRNLMVKVLIDGYDTEEDIVNNTLNIQKYYRSLLTENRKIANINHKWIWYNKDDTKDTKFKLINNICELFKKDTINRSNKQQVKCDYEVWTDNGWQKILRVIRHKTNKKIYRISSGLGIVDVTEDHSLCNSDKIPIKPNELEINSTKLLHYQFNDYEKLCEPAIVPEYPSLFYGDNIKQKHTKYDNTKKYECHVCFESYDGDMFYWNISKKRNEFVHSYRCKLCVKKKQCELKNIEFNGKLNRKVQDIKMNEYELDEDEAWLWGFFLGDGSCGEYRCPSGLKYSWALNNQSLYRLNRAKDILNKIEDVEFKILDTMESSHVYKLVPKGSLRYMVHKYRKFMYDEIKNKKVPMIILNASYSIRKAFFDGYYEADGTKGKEGKFIENEKEEKENGNWNLKYKKVDFTTKGKLTAQGLYILATSLGFNLSVRRWNKKDRVYSLNSYDTNHKYHKDRNIVKYVEEAINHEMDDGFVYDIETTTGRFAVGIGSIVATQTDSVFIKLPPLSCYKKYGHPTEKQNILQYNVDVGEQLSADFQKLLKPPHCLEWEKMFYPFIIFSKKRYVGNLYEHDVNKFKQKSMGIVLKRRDNANIVKIIYGGVIDIILNEVDINKSLEFLDKSLKRLANGEYPLEELVVTKTLRGFYKNPLQIAHKVLADRMKKRDPGSAPQSNDRVPYIYVNVKEKSNVRLLQGDKIEDPKFIIENELTPDYGHYITNQIMKPCLQLYSIVLEDLKGYKYKNNKDYWIKLEKNLMAEKKDKVKVETKIKQLREKNVEELLFSKYINKIKNEKNGTTTMSNFISYN
jgi:DNA polymerase elongation subunit (family B)